MLAYGLARIKRVKIENKRLRLRERVRDHGIDWLLDGALIGEISLELLVRFA